MPECVSGAIIAAGRGDRLRGAVDGLPKPMVELGGKPLLLNQIEMMSRIGIAPIHVIVNSETGELIKQRAVIMPPTVELCVANTASSMESLFRLGEQIPSGRFLLATVDALIPEHQWRCFVDRASDLVASSAGGLAGALGVVRWRGDKRPLFVGAEAGGLINYLGDEQHDWVTAGIYFFSTRIFGLAQDARRTRLDALRRFLAFLVERQMRLVAVPLSEALDIDEEADLEEARALTASRTKAGASG
jgi:choline kinase